MFDINLTPETIKSLLFGAALLLVLIYGIHIASKKGGKGKDSSSSSSTDTEDK